MVLSHNSTLKPRILVEFLSSLILGHSIFQKAYARAYRSFFWAGMKQDILTFIAECDVYQCNKGETIKKLGILQPLPLLASIWINASMNFITVLPKLGNKSTLQICLFLCLTTPIHSNLGGSILH